MSIVIFFSPRLGFSEVASCSQNMVSGGLVVLGSAQQLICDTGEASTLDITKGYISKIVGLHVHCESPQAGDELSELLPETPPVIWSVLTSF